MTGGECTLQSSYDLDQGDGEGVRRYVDTRHLLRAGPRVDGMRVIVTSGENEFGPFIGAGTWTESGAEPRSVTLSIGRRYLDCRDERAALSCSALMAELLREGEWTASNLLHSSLRKRAAKSKKRKADAL
jgi:hypothetical protein